VLSNQNGGKIVGGHKNRRAIESLANSLHALQEMVIFPDLFGPQEPSREVSRDSGGDKRKSLDGEDRDMQPPQAASNSQAILPERVRAEVQHQGSDGGVEAACERAIFCRWTCRL